MKTRSKTLTAGKYYRVQGPNGIYCIFAESHYHAISQAIGRDGGTWYFRHYKVLPSTLRR